MPVLRERNGIRERLFGSARWVAAATLVTAMAACGGNGGGPSANASLPTGVEPAFPGLSFSAITDIRAQVDAAGEAYLYVVEKGGRIYRLDPDTGAPSVQLYLDVSGLDQFTIDGEQGLLGLAFDPDYVDNGFFYVHLVKENPRRVVIARFRQDDMLPVDPGTQEEVLIADEFEFLSSFSNHVAGGMAFGPVDGLLYLTMGDGGSSFDPDDAAQDRTDLRGSVLRIDVSTTGNGGTPIYRIPESNPFAGNADDFREEIFAYGLRNPFRLSIERVDAGTQRVWVADVGQNELEEVNIVAAGGNYGWDCREGTRSVPEEDASSTCGMLADDDFESPVVEYDHSLGRSITGGYVYTGDRLAGELTGRYVYGDFGSGLIWAYDPDSGANDRLVDTDLSISTFGTGPEGELYIADFAGGELYRLTP